MEGGARAGGSGGAGGSGTGTGDPGQRGVPSPKVWPGRGKSFGVFSPFLVWRVAGRGELAWGPSPPFPATPPALQKHRCGREGGGRPEGWAEQWRRGGGEGGMAGAMVPTPPGCHPGVLRCFLRAPCPALPLCSPPQPHSQVGHPASSFQGPIHPTLPLLAGPGRGWWEMVTHWLLQVSFAGHPAARCGFRSSLNHTAALISLPLFLSPQAPRK